MSILALACGAALACSGRPLVTAFAPDCHPGNGAIALSLCGIVDGKAVVYFADPRVVARELLPHLGFDTTSADGVWIAISGSGQWAADDEPNQVSGWLVRPPPSWAGDGAWMCGQMGTITHHADDSIDATLGGLAILPPCSGAGGPASLHVDVQADPGPFDDGTGCWFGFRVNDARLLILAAACPRVGAPLALDGVRIASRGATSDTTACAGAGATVTVVPDASVTPPFQHLLVDIPSMSAPEPCAPPVGGQLMMQVIEHNPADGGRPG